MKRARRGVALLTVLVVVAVLVFLVAAALTFTGREAASASQYKRREVIAACAAGARAFVLSQMRSGAQGRLVNGNIAGEIVVGDLHVRTGHLDEWDGGVPSVAVSPCTNFNNSSITTDLTNTTPGPGNQTIGGCSLVVAHCIDMVTGDKSEIEFQITQAL